MHSFLIEQALKALNINKKKTSWPIYIESVKRLTHDCDWKIPIGYWLTYFINK